MSPISRRSFIAVSSCSLAGLGIAGSPSFVKALSPNSRQSLNSFLPDIIDPETLKQLAVLSMDAAKGAGAQYADVRIAFRRTFYMGVNMDLLRPPNSILTFDCSYGIRVWIDGACAFVSGAEPTRESVTHAAKQAAATAKELSRAGIRAQTLLAPAPVVTGEWRAPVQIDPFSVSPDDHFALLGAYYSAAKRRLIRSLVPSFDWAAEIRVFASSDGSLITQNFAEAKPNLLVRVSNRLDMGVDMIVEESAPVSAGFEVGTGYKFQEAIVRTAEEAEKLFSYPAGNAEVGRYDAVFDGRSVAALLGETLVPALELGRALGEEADSNGTSFVAPMHDMLGQQLFSPQLTVQAHRSLPELCAAKWDDEGVEVKEFPVIKDGSVVDYFGTRATVPALAEWYAKRGLPLETKGTATSWTPLRAPLGAPVSVRMSPGTDNNFSSIDALAKELGNGILVRNLSGVDSDQQLSGGYCSPSMLFEVRKGAITRRLRSGVIAFSSKSLWKSIKQLGNEQTVSYDSRHRFGGAPWAAMRTVTRAPAALLTKIDLTLPPRF